MDKSTSALAWARIQGFMAATKLNQAGLARRLNVATNVVTNWKQRGGAPYGRAAEIAQALGVPLDTLLAGPIPKRMVTSPAVQKLVDRLQALDRGGLMTPEVAAALNAVLDLVEARSAGEAGSARKRRQ